MQYDIKIVIATNDTILSVGLRHLILNLFDIDAKIIENPQDAGSEIVDLFIADANTFAANTGFFIQRRTKLALITETICTDDNIGFILNRHSNEKEFIRQLTNVVETTRNNHTNGNELSQREIEVLCLLAKGLTNKEIADRLFISVNTVLSHRKNISSKLGIRSVSGLSVYAIMNGYINEIPGAK